ncbi:lipoyl(octanoyl) transferase LipB [Arthrobacter sp. B10-11]|uniref:lipoyl(octanoyl) transferase LipB n=1 Tax=Arthrobacter sp. B10-11 TaxID=3081160 RepID=UPI002953321F|nr:lipoyl(octanoyl) transferase LipB [Arthrobacter sp. B10-11]MDV8148528.1 lipoyl(octanoyl) transferase LipB [Arthrobacter sp. B10-11]
MDAMTLEFSTLGLAPDFVDYMKGWEIQRELHDKVVAAEAPSTVLLLEHAAVYTAGKLTEDHERPFDGTPVVAVDRGGKLTWHGPGQLIAYPVLKLKNRSGIRDYVERLEAVMIAVMADYGINAERIKGRAGVWIKADSNGPDRKIAAIGIRVLDGVTMHGIAINCSNDLGPYAQIIACGITDAGVTTMSIEAGRTITPADIADRVVEEFRKHEEALVSNPEGALL